MTADEIAKEVWEGANLLDKGDIEKRISQALTQYADEVGFTCYGASKRVSELLTEIESLKKENEDAHKVLDNDPSRIIRNAKDGYPDGRPDRILSLAERVKAICKYGADYKRWLEESENQVSVLRGALEEIESYRNYVDYRLCRLQALERVK